MSDLPTNPALRDIELARRYSMRFGTSVPTASLQGMSPDEVNAMIERALETGQPVPGWDSKPAFSTQAP